MTQNLANSSKNFQKSEFFSFDFIKNKSNNIDFNGLDRRSLIDYAKAKGLEMIPKTHKITRWLYKILCDKYKNNQTIYFKQSTIIEIIENKFHAQISRKSLTRANKELHSLGLVMIVHREKMQSNMYFPNIELFQKAFLESFESPDNTPALEIHRGTLDRQYYSSKEEYKVNFREDNFSFKKDSEEKVKVEDKDVLDSKTIRECQSKCSLTQFAVLEYFENFVKGKVIQEEATGKRLFFARHQWRKYFIKHIERESQAKREREVNSAYIAFHKRQQYLASKACGAAANQTPIVEGVDEVQVAKERESINRAASYRNNPVQNVRSVYDATAGAVFNVSDLNDPRNVNRKVAVDLEDPMEKALQEQLNRLLGRYSQ